MFKSKSIKTSLIILLISCLSFTVVLLTGCEKIRALMGSEKGDMIGRIEAGLRPAMHITGYEDHAMYLPNRMLRHHVPGLSIAVIQNYEILWMKSYGSKNVETGEQLTLETPMQTGAISKSLTALAVMLMAQDATIDLDLDKNINNYLKENKLPENRFTNRTKVTPRMLIRNYGGVSVPGFLGYEEEDFLPQPSQIIDGRAPAKNGPIRVVAPPGKTYKNSAGGYAMIEYMINDLSEMAFSKYMKQFVFTPLEMNSSIINSPLPEEWHDQVAAGHYMDGTKVVGRYLTYIPAAPTALWSTAPDLARMSISLMKAYAGKENKIIAKETAETMLKPVDSWEGYGFHIARQDVNTHFWQAGSTQGFESFLLAYPLRGEGVVILANGNGGVPLYQEIVRSLASEYGWEDFGIETRDIARLKASVPRQYAGEYQIPGESMRIKFMLEDKRLYAEIEPEILSKTIVYPSSASEFFMSDAAYTFKFVNSEEGLVDHLEVTFNMLNHSVVTLPPAYLMEKY